MARLVTIPKSETKAIEAAAAWAGMGDMTRVEATTDIYRKLGWHVTKEQLLTSKGEVTGTYATIRHQPQPDGSTQRIILGDKLSDQYEIIQNVDAINGLAPLFDAGLKPIFAGSIDNGRRIAVAMEFEDALIVGKTGSDVIYRFVMYTNTHDGSSTARLELVGRRQVCSNGATIGSNATMRVMHKGRANEGVQAAISALDVANRQFIVYGERLEHLTSLPIRAADINRYVKLVWFPKATDRELDEKRERIDQIRAQVERAFIAGPGANEAETRGTAYGLYQAANYYLNHETRGARDVSMLWGQNRNLDLRALEVAGRLA